MAPLKIANDGSIATPSSPRPIINPHGAKRPHRASGAAADGPQERILADRNGEPYCQTVSRSAAKSETQSMNDALQSGSSACEGHRDAFVEPFGKYLPPADRLHASKPADREL